MDCNTDLSIIFRPIALGDDNTGASCQAAKKTDDRVDDGTHRSHRRQCFLSHKVAYHNTIYSIVELLEYVAHHQRQCKPQQLLPDDPLRHVGVFLFLYLHVLIFPPIILPIKTGSNPLQTAPL